ncbi:MAG: DUF1800 domain-containing protein, partial [Armatimonadetes bacterium]|nr:DUF1800 domain-containing protein [Armatimonadota bacterium]
MGLTEKEKIAHLLRRFAFGASEMELDYYGKNGLQGAIELLLNYAAVTDDFTLDVSEIGIKNNVQPRTVQIWWLLRMANTKRPLEEKMTLYWHNHFATSAAKVSGAYMMVNQNSIFRNMGMGRFEDLLLEVSKDPAMLFWLDNQDNVKGKPNENFAREIMELFTLGVGNYTEKDIQESARAFTGWRFAARRGEGTGPKNGRGVVFKFD